MMDEYGENLLIENEDVIVAFIKKCNSINIPLTRDNICYIKSIGIVASYANISSLLNPGLSMDKEGLVSMKYLNKHFELNPLVPGHVFAENHMLIVSKSLRRGFHPNAVHLQGLNSKLWKENPFKSKNDMYVSIDFDRVRINVNNSTLLEFDKWFGEPFKYNINEIQDGTIKMKPPQDIMFAELLFNNVYALDIKWKTKDGAKVFYAEEFLNEEVTVDFNGIKYHPIRYIHSEFDLSYQTFRHLDGATHLYTEQEYHMRRNSDLNYNIKNDVQIKGKSNKAFKINGILTTLEWSDYCTSFMNGNHLLSEYFQGELPENIKNKVEALRKNNIN